MSPDWLAMFKPLVESTLKKLLNFVGERYARHKASKRSMLGEDLASQGSLYYLVKIELERLAASDKLPPGLQSNEVRSWLRRGDNVELFIEVLIARAGNLSSISNRAEEQLATEYERMTGETRKLASGPVSLAVSHVYGQLMATETGKKALQLAIGQWTAAKVLSLRPSEQPDFPSEADLARVKAMAATLLEAGKRSWKMPRFVAPLTLEAHVRQDDQQSYPTNSSEVFTAIEAGDSLVLFGAGGIGKTTFLLDLCASSMDVGRRVPMYVDAAVWAGSNEGLFEYLASLPAAQRNGVTSGELTKLAERGRLVIMLNGWNEMPASSELVCRDGLLQLKAVAEALSIVVVSRTPNDTPGLPRARQIEVRGLTWQGQSAVIRAEVGDDKAAPLLDLLAKNVGLRRAARSPLILRGLIAQARKGAVGLSSIFDLLGAAVQAFEGDDQRRLMLSTAPVEGHQHAYLEELACMLTQRLTTNCSRDDALQAIYSAATRLAQRQLIGAPPNLASILDVLINHHLLHLDDGVVRFAHQRFQEYFAATRLLHECFEDVVPLALLHTAVNQPAWNESLVLVAGKLNGVGGVAVARVRLVKSAAELDLGFACDLAGICGFTETDDSELYHQIIVRVNELAASPLEEVRDLGVAYQIASGFPAFAEKLWLLLENEDQQVRLHTYRLNGSAISLAQLGAGAEQRIASWPPERRVEFVHEIADNADNYEFLLALARSEPDPSARAAAISALLWHFPASDVPLQAWLDAPVEVQTEENLLREILYSLEDGYASDAVRERLQAISINDASGKLQLQLALAFPNKVGPYALDVIFERLRTGEGHRNEAPLVAIAGTHAPERLFDLARELALHARIVPEWVGECLHETPVDVRTDVFEQAWAILQGQDFKNLNSKVLGPLADRNQTERLVASWLQYFQADRSILTDIDHEKHRHLESLLAHVPGSELLNVVMQRGQAASYNEAAQLVDVISRRMGREEESTTAANQWLPTVDEVRQLIAVFGEKIETADNPQDAVRVYLCSVASRVAAPQFGSFLLETCRRHLDAWSIFKEKVNQWLKTRTSPRPNNPYLGLYLQSDLVKWGLDALPGLLEMMAHPSGMEFIPEAIGRIISLPWASKQERLFSSIRTDIEEGELRRKMGREFRQPDDTYQYWTDEAAKVLGLKLTELVVTYEKKKVTEEKWNTREAEYRVGRLAGILASIPSGGVVEPVHRALVSGLMDVYGTVGVLRGLMRQGWYISDAAIVGQIETLYEQLANAKWHDDSMRYAMSQLSELLLCVTPASLLRKPISHYLHQWRRFSYPNEIIRHLSTIHSEAAWQALLGLAREIAKKGREPEELEGLTSALASALMPQHLNEFFAIVADGTLFCWCRNEWTLERAASSVAAVLSKAVDQIEPFVEACRKAQSPLADAFAVGVLSNIKGCEEARQSYLIAALDAGRAIHPNMPAYRMLRETFTQKVPINNSQYEITPKANNKLRAILYERAKGSGPISQGCRVLLASLECERREAGRPEDEARHPAPEEGLAWTDVLLFRG